MDWGRDLKAAFAAGKPVLLYWGAGWCPPCNRSKALQLNGPGFAALADRLSLLHIDGDVDGAQALGAQLSLRSYPTFVLYHADGREITRLPCETDGATFASLLEHALTLAADGWTVAAALFAALEGGRALSTAEWTQLAFYSWDTDEASLLGPRNPMDTLATLANHCPEPGAKARLALHALNAGAALPFDLAFLLQHGQFDVITNYATNLVRNLPGDLHQHAAQWSLALDAIEKNPATSAIDQMIALRGRVRMLRLGAQTPGLLDHARHRIEQVMGADTDAASRHVLLNTCAGLLIDAGDNAAAEALLQAELPRAHSAYYFMHTLAGLAKKRGDIPAALNWYEQAAEGARGQATRLQWSAAYIQALLDLSPQSTERIDKAVRHFQFEFDDEPDTHQQRNLSNRKKLEAKLAAWRA